MPGRRVNVVTHPKQALQPKQHLTLAWDICLYTVKGKKPDLSLLFGIPEIKSKSSRSTYMTLVLGTLFKTWQLVPTRDRGSNPRSAVQPPALTGAAGWWRGRSPMALPQHSRTCALSSRACRGACRHCSSPWKIRNVTGKGKSLQSPELHQRTHFPGTKSVPSPPR